MDFLAQINNKALPHQEIDYMDHMTSKVRYIDHTTSKVIYMDRRTPFGFYFFSIHMN